MVKFRKAENRCKRPSGVRAIIVTLVAPLVVFIYTAAEAGTCKDPGKHLTKREYQNVKTACEQMDAAMAGWTNPAEGRRRLLAIQADEFEFFVPTSDALRFHRGTREEYIRLVTETQSQSFAPASRYTILATTAQGNRVAMEMESDIHQRDGTTYQSRYHQLYEFNDAGKVRIYKIYMDTAALVRETRAAQERVVAAFFRALSASPPAGFEDLFTNDATWTGERAGTATHTMDHATVLKTISDLPKSFRELTVTPDMSGAIEQDNRMAVQAKSHGAFSNGTEYNNIYHFLFVLENGRIKGIREYSPSKESPEVSPDKAREGNE
jgi:uncharacterized protein